MYSIHQVAPPPGDRLDLAAALFRWRVAIEHFTAKLGDKEPDLPSFTDWPDWVLEQAVYWKRPPRDQIVAAFHMKFSQPSELMWLTHVVCNPEDPGTPDAVTDAWLSCALDTYRIGQSKYVLDSIRNRHHCYSPEFWRKFSETLALATTDEVIAQLDKWLVLQAPRGTLGAAAIARLHEYHDGQEAKNLCPSLYRFRDHAQVLPSAALFPKTYTALRRQWPAVGLPESLIADTDKDGVSDGLDPSPRCPLSAKPPQTAEQAVVQAWAQCDDGTQPIRIAWSGPCRDVVHRSQQVFPEAKGQPGIRARPSRAVRFGR